MTTLREIAGSINARASGAGLDTVVPATGSAVTHDSRRVVPGGIFVAITGAHRDGNNFISDVMRRGALAVISGRSRPANFPGVWLQVDDARTALAQAAAAVHGYPSRSLRLVGVTGTNGKTTVAHLTESIFLAAGEVPAMMGTISYRIGDEQVDAEFTTPEASEIQDFLRRAVEAGSRYAVMEVSSHAIDLRRVEGLEFAVAAFTNLTQDHLDYHKTLDEYFAVKRRLFEGRIGSSLLPPARSVINLDDERGAELKAIGGAQTITYALEAEADVTTDARDFGLNGLDFIARMPEGEINVVSSLVGRPHAYNCLCAVGIGIALGFDPDTIARGITGCRLVSGRFERASGDEDDITVIVDYAHTPDALLNVLRTVRDAVRGKRCRVITVFGCGGDRDKTKRPLMGEAAAQLSDHVIVTSDNPRSENPAAILDDIEPGLKNLSTPYEMIVDRREAIFRAITQASPGDVVMVAGKGHETYQILPTGKIHFDDREVAREALTERRSRI
ncbi:MAG TPA: UDP-N-acetylmuramoyl-L-alanyl-D-glutamate--2,6-diaminopimelate ligase [Blastocatellia bacterium]|nr:UDP-N-acetylmuramoyl-L-alanyl-D-glutamate--2,6-diaminopimelate ligase [Blastocatellia bacterium]